MAPPCGGLFLRAAHALAAAHAAAALLWLARARSPAGAAFGAAELCSAALFDFQAVACAARRSSGTSAGLDMCRLLAVPAHVYFLHAAGAMPGRLRALAAVCVYVNMAAAACLVLADRRAVARAAPGLRLAAHLAGLLLVAWPVWAFLE